MNARRCLYVVAWALWVGGSAQLVMCAWQEDWWGVVASLACAAAGSGLFGLLLLLRDGSR